MPNVQIPDHPLIGTDHTYRPIAGGWEQYDPDTDTEGGVLIIGHGMKVTIKAVFRNWNGVPGLDMFYVYCPATSHHTHVTPADLMMVLDSSRPLHPCDTEFGLLHDHDPVECDRMMDLMSGDGADDGSWEAEAYNRDAEETALGRPLAPNEY